MGELTGSLNLFCAVLTAILYSAILGRRSKLRANLLFRNMFPVLFVMLSFHGSAMLFFDSVGFWYRLLEAFSLSGMYVLMGLFTWYVAVLTNTDEGLFRVIEIICGGLCAIDAVIWFVTCFRPILYDLALHRYVNTGVLFYFAQFIGFAVIVLNIFILLFRHGLLDRRDAILVMLLPLLPVLSYITDLFLEVRLRYVMIFLAMLMNYLRVNLRLEQRVRDQEKAVETYRLRSTLERIKPHYIYNVLSSIYYLCDSDPAAAQRATGMFADYLRLAMENTEGDPLIPFERELATVRNYLKLENMRFGDRIRVHYNINAIKFMVPPFTLQPLVENSVKHGADQTEGTAHIYIETSENALGWTVTVRDTCGGFDPRTAEQGTGTKYIADILELTVQGTFKLDSTPGVGTVASVFIPKQLTNNN